jgi:hypothetical protein
MLMPEDFVPVAAYGTPLEADLAKNYLEAEGILVLLSDDATVGWFWYLGNAVGGIKLLVPRDQVERAAAVLAARPGGQPESCVEAGQGAEASGTGGVACARCGARMDPDMDYCPACGEAPPDATRASPDSPAGNGRAAGEEELEEQAASPGDDLANRALRAAILGLILCPPLLQVYSLWLLLRLAFHQGEVSDAGIRRMLGALILDSVVIVATCPLWMYAFQF